MKLPASLLTQLRVGIAAGAALAAGCDAAEPDAAGEAPAEQASPDAEDGAVPAAPDTQWKVSVATEVPERTRTPGLSGAVARAVEETRPISARPTVDEDPTAFVPFSASPGPRVKERTESPLAFGPPPKAKPRTKRPRKHSKVGAPSWDGCPACGRG